MDHQANGPPRSCPQAGSRCKTAATTWCTFTSSRWAVSRASGSGVGQRRDPTSRLATQIAFHIARAFSAVIGQGPAGNPANLPPVLVAALAPLTAAVAALTAGQAALQAAVAPLAPALAALQAGQAALQAGQAALQAQIFNVGRRAQNAATHNVQPRHSAVLAALAKEQLPPAGAVNAAAVGAMPPPGVFPVTWAALGAVRALFFYVDVFCFIYG